MNGKRKETELPLDVQENIIENIEKLFVGQMDSYKIRDALISHNWDLEESIRYLHKNLPNTQKEKKPTAKKSEAPSKVKNSKPEPTQSHVPPPNSGGKQLSSKFTNPAKKCELFKKGPTSKEKVKEEDEGETNDWVIVEERKRAEPGSSGTREVAYPDKSRLIQSYNIIKLFGETTTRLAAYIKEGIRVMVILRGCSGSGKTTYAKELLNKEGAKYPENHIFSSDSYFVKSDGSYCFDHNCLQEAHEWNQKLVELAGIEGRSPIFVDNTNTRLWEMSAYAKLAVKYGYVFETLEPPTPWFFNEDILVRKTRHGTPRETIQNMLDRYEANLSGEDVLRKLNLIYSSDLQPPQPALADLDIPASRKHKLMLSLPLKRNVIYQASGENTFLPSKSIVKKGVKTPQPGLRTDNLINSADANVCLPLNSKLTKQASGENNSPNPKNNSNKKVNTLHPDLSTGNLINALVHPLLNLTLTNEVSGEKSSPTPKNNLNKEDRTNMKTHLFYDTTPLVDLTTHKLINPSVANVRPRLPSNSEFKPSTGGSVNLIPGSLPTFTPLTRNVEVFSTNNSASSHTKDALPSSYNRSSESPSKDIGNNEFVAKESIVEGLIKLNNPDTNQVARKGLHVDAATSLQKSLQNPSLPLKPSFNACNFEYVLIGGDNNVIFQKHHLEMEDVHTLEEFRAFKAITDVSTLTEDSDFETLKNIEFGFVGPNHKIIVGNKDYFSVGDGVKNVKSDGNKCDKSTLTGEIEKSRPSDDAISRLHSLFPSIDRDKLEEMFGGGNIDIDWAVGLLLDSGAQIITAESEPHISSSLPEQFTQSFSVYLDEEPNGVQVGQRHSLPNKPTEVSTSNDENMDPFNINKLNRSGNSNVGRIGEMCFVGDWDYTKGVPKAIPLDAPKLQRALRPRPILNKPSVSTNTNYTDFETLRNVMRQSNTDHLPNVLKGNPHFVSGQTVYFQTSSVLMLEKGTMTSDIETNQIELLDSGVDRLALMFPQISRENLQELLQKCQNDIDWAAGLLLDSGQEMCELYTSLEPLESVKVKESEKSIVDASDPSPKTSAKKPKKRRKVRQSKSDNQLHESLQKQLENNFVLSERPYSFQNVKNMKALGPVCSESEDISSTADRIDDDESSTENTEEEVVFMVDSDFILQLQSRFGGLIRPNMLAEKNVVSLPLSLARQLHSYIMDSVQEHIQEENIFTDEDEEYARQVQEEEMRSVGTPSLLEIMDEEVALRKCQKESQNGRSMASTLSKQLLLERFPKMDPVTLASILEDTNHSLHQATYVLASAGHTQAEPQSPSQSAEEEKVSLSREEAIKQADAYGDVASQLYDLRKDCLRKSQKAYRAGNHSVALYYSDMARWYMERIEKSNSMAAKALLAGYEGCTTLDLHFLQVSEALNLLDLFLDEVIRGLQKSGDRKAVVYIITGRGLHSVGGKSRLKPAVQARLVRRDIRFADQNPGMLKVIINRTALASYSQISEQTV